MLEPSNLKSAADGSKIILLDSEGFFGSDVSEVYDAKIFAVTTLLSSHLIYNSIKLIDQSSVDYLQLLARRTQLFHKKNKKNSSLLLSENNPAVLSQENNNKNNNNNNKNSNDNDNNKSNGNRMEENNIPSVLKGEEFPPLTWVVKDFVQNMNGRTPSDWLNEFLDGYRGILSYYYV